MAFTYSVSTDRGKIRLMLQDNDSNDYILEDDEIDAALVLGGNNLYISAAEAARMIAAYFAQCAPKMLIEGNSFLIDRTKQPEYWLNIADKLEARANSKPYSTTQEVEDEDRDLQDAYVNKYEYRPHDAPESD